jgi:hypothetical protein
MKIISKTYLLVGVLIGVAFFNLFVLYNTQVTATSESYSIIRAGDLKTKVETIAGLAGSIASGRETDRPQLEKEINEFDTVLSTLRNGGMIRGQEVAAMPSGVLSDYEVVNKIWSSYKTDALEIQTTSIYNEDVVSAVNYVLEKNTELILTADALTRDLETLSRDYNRHREIALELRETAKVIGQNALLVSLGQEDEAKQNLHKSRTTFDAGMRKLLQIPLDGLDLSGTNIRPENLVPIPRENSTIL